MGIDALNPRVQAACDRGAVVVVKWDGGRATLRSTVLVTHARSGFQWRRETDHPDEALAEALDALARAHVASCARGPAVRRASLRHRAAFREPVPRAAHCRDPSRYLHCRQTHARTGA